MHEIEKKLCLWRLPFAVAGNGPKMSIVTQSKAPSTGIGSHGTLPLFLGFFFMAQSTQELCQSSMSLNIPCQ